MVYWVGSEGGEGMVGKFFILRYSYISNMGLPLGLEPLQKLGVVGGVRGQKTF